MRTATQARAVETRDRILRTAAGLFALKGYHDTKLDEIQRASEVTTGAFFHHFRSKEDLGFAVIDRHMQLRREMLDEIEREQAVADVSEPLQQVFCRLDAIQQMIRLRQQRKGGCLIGNLSTELSDTHDPFRKRLAECFDEMAAEFQPQLDAAARKLPLRKRPDSAELARYIVTVIEGAIMQGRTHHDPTLISRQFAFLKQHLEKCFDV